MVANLRDILLDSLRTLPGTRNFHIHVLQSSPRRNTTLFQFAKPRPRTYVQDVLVLLSEQSHHPDAPRILVTAIEANLYHIPATSSAILYVCKVDSTGQSGGSSPTRALVRAFLRYYTDNATRPLSVRHLWIHLFARAQGQYLFPNSSQFEGKRPLGDVKLCAWWKRILSLAALDVVESCKTTTMPLPHSSVSPLTANTVQAFYVLPGYSQLEAENFLQSGSSEVVWEYGHPYSVAKGSLPCPPEGHSLNLGHYIPYFDDDPKSRFLDEIAYTTNGEVKSPVRKRARTGSSAVGGIQRKNGDGEGSREKEKEKENGKEKDDRPLGELGKVTPDEFWERMSFRQECVMGAVTGFFTLVVSAKDKDEGEGASKGLSNHEAPSPLEPRPGEVSSQIYKRVLTALTTGVEFSTAERAIKSTETLESTIKRLCDGMAPPSHAQRSSTPEPKARTQPSTPPRSSRRAEAPDITPNPFPEPEATLEMYQAHIYGTVAVANAAADGAGARRESSGSGAAVRVLTARKKQKGGAGGRGGDRDLM